MKNLSKLEEVKDLREVWKHESLDFTPWLAENLDLLSDAIGIDIELIETESNVGSFSLDILAKEISSERLVVIENQLEDTNHDHLGKLITYASGKDASIIIWIVKKAREEHRKAIEWLNNITDENIGFFLVETKLYKIGNSDPAVKFEVVEEPNNWAKEIKNNNSSPIQQERYEYWIQFNEYANKTNFFKYFNKNKTSKTSYVSYCIGNGCYILLSQLRYYNKLTVEWYITNNKNIYHELYSKKDDIENELGFEFEWKLLPDKKASRIITGKEVDFDNKEDWNNQFKYLIDTAIKMKKVFNKYYTK